MDDECEEGEILDIEEDEDVYTPLERPSALEVHNHQQPTRLPESDSDDPPESSNSDSDSSSGPCIAKKRKVHRLKPPHQSRRDGPRAGQSNARNKKYNNVWAVGLEEEALTHHLENLNGLESYSRDRGVESYDFTQAGQRDDDDDDNSHDETDSTEIKDENISDDCQPDLRAKISNKRRYDDRGHVKQRLGRRLSPSDLCRSQNEELYHARVILDLSKTVSDSDEDVAKDMAVKLFEEKEDLILRVVKILGKEKAISLFEETQRVEAQGGMLIMNGSRRRSPGGVFLFILKGDDTVTHELKNEIFIEDARKSRDVVRRTRKARLKKLCQDERAKLAKDGLLSLDPALPDLLTRAELVVQKASVKKNKTGDGAVSNPPPSPATDNRGDSSNDSPPHRPSILSDRVVREYQDDFLDVYGEGMDEL